MTGLPYITADAIMDDGTSYPVKADQRDQHRALLPPGMGGAGISSPDVDPLGFLRAVGWAYLSRTGVLNGMTYPQFDAACAFVQPVDAEGADAEVGPTWPAPDH